MYQFKVNLIPSLKPILGYQFNFFLILLLLSAYLISCPGRSFTKDILTFLPNLISFSLVILVYLLDRLTKIFVIQLDKNNVGSDIFNSTYLNIALIWNKGIAFGLFSFNEAYFYNILTLIITIIIFILIFMSLKSEGFKKYSLLMIIGGALGNLHDRIFSKAVPDFIDLHINNFHWFIFNVSDIFITLGVISLIVLEIVPNKKENYD